MPVSHDVFDIASKKRQLKATTIINELPFGSSLHQKNYPDFLHELDEMLELHKISDAI